MNKNKNIKIYYIFCSFVSLFFLAGLCLVLPAEATQSSFVNPSTRKTALVVIDTPSQLGNSVVTSRAIRKETIKSSDLNISGSPKSGKLLSYNSKTKGFKWVDEQNAVNTDNLLNTTTAFSGDVSGTYNNLVVADDSHAHTGSTISGIDISNDTNLAGDTEVVLTDDTLSLASGITRDSEWDSVAEIETATGSDIITSAENQDKLVGTKDVDETGIANGKILKYNSTSGKWEIGDDNGGTSYTAGDGLDLSTGEFSTDLLAIGGLQISTGELGIKLDGATLTLGADGLKIADTYDDNFLTTSTNFVGDVTGTSGETAVGNDSHSHTSTTLPVATSYLGSAIESTEITNDEVLEIDLKASNAAGNGQVLSYNSSTGGFTWVDAGGTGTVTSVATGSGLSGGPVTTTGTISLGNLTTDWDQQGAYDIFLNNIGSELKILGSGGTYFGIFDVGNITEADKTYTFPNVSGTVITNGDTGTVTNTMLSGSIADSKLNQLTTAGKVAGSAVQLATDGGLEDSTGLKVKLDGTTLALGAGGLKVADAYDDNFLTSSSWAAPGTIGSGTPNTGAFTTITASATIKVGSSVAICDGTEEGKQRYNSTSHDMEFCNGTSWTSMTGGGGTTVPSGTIAFFDLASCPTGWTELTGLRGKYVVGLPSGGTRGSGAGTALTDLENRATGSHTHPITDPGHSHSTGIRVEVGGTAPSYSATGDIYASPLDTTSSTTGITVNAPAAPNNVAGTNAPYIQYLACKKD
ncbi:MAG: hypothetical protein V1690_00815 [Candidatus Moraniibacteriota bacterium]